MRNGWPLNKFLFALITVLVTALVPLSTQAQGIWEMKVCAPPDDFPASSSEQPGFENRIAEIVADALGATLSYVWTPIDDLGIDTYLRTGECDVVMGVGDGAAELLSTVAYYRTPYVFVQRSGDTPTVASFEDEVLNDRLISTYPNSGPHRAIIHFGLQENYVQLPPVGGSAGPDYAPPIIDALLAGDIDVGVLYGPDAAALVRENPGELEIAPVAPQIVPPLIQLYRTATMAVRPGDESLRDSLNLALALRWDEIQQVFAEFGVPLLQLAPPQAPRLPVNVARIGMILPLPSGHPLPTDAAAGNARTGALLGEDVASRQQSSNGIEVDVVLASSPTAEAATRAAQRLLATPGVSALAGGLGEGQAEALARISEDSGVPFLNMGSSELAVRRMCVPSVFHVEASPAMYQAVLFDWYARSGFSDWFLVYSADDVGRALYAEAQSVIESLDGLVVEVGSATVQTGGIAFYDTLETIRQAAPEAVMLLLEPGAQEFFLAQYESAGLDAQVATFPHPETQTREFAIRLRQVAPRASLAPRAALWEANFSAGSAGELNESYAGRTGDPMEPVAWAALAAVEIAATAAQAVGSAQPQLLLEFLRDPRARFDIHKELPAYFDQSDHQLLQQLFVVAIDGDAQWGMRLTNRLQIVDLLRLVPSVPVGPTDGADPDAAETPEGGAAAADTTDVDGSGVLQAGVTTLRWLTSGSTVQCDYDLGIPKER